ncbi:PLP-dependent aminotransferase family protein [Nitratifractor salsuginis]|uniref:Transcriptional regulator, GntR family with aminotransferase domain protein n=1 Tax=Nitratifractor salsuginis (strain DSM 16511 / JCM 12458 / E9I37-1) TaxID=749222 RepID=E6X2P4_NITSE|nr:PLP-dependent aminotransferase family protein [Nitratifractor salsuginis]ADV46110.1 transcriptional regulator, GntR family with aminotransferase domain protein [Nitratifractor salsuginis DSM 16511]
MLLPLDDNAGTPLYEQLYRVLKSWIVNEAEAGERLPSVRALAKENRLSRTTVESAYAQLYAEGYIQSRPRSGYYVAEDLLSVHSPHSLPSDSPEPRSGAGSESCYDFCPARLSREIFPMKLWRRLTLQALQEDLDMGAYPEGQGESGLRRALADYLNRIRGTRCRPDQIVLCAGFSEAVSLAAALIDLLPRTLAIEYPGYRLTEQIFTEHGYDIKWVGVGARGIDLEALESTSARVLYTTPSRQYPTGVTLPIAKRQALLEWAERNSAYLLEDDYDSELNYLHRPIPAMQGLDRGGRVLYLGTFSKSLSPALRVAYLVLPDALLERYRSLSRSHFAQVSLPLQKTLELFITGGHWERHLRRVRTLNRRRHDRMLKALQRELGDEIEILSSGGGLAIPVRPRVAIDLVKLREVAATKGLRLYLASDFYGKDWEALRMGFGGLSEEQIDAGVAELAKLWRELRER